MFKLKAVLFDFDQTLVNSADGFRKTEHWLEREMFAFLKLSDWSEFMDFYRKVRASGSNDGPSGKTHKWVEVCRHFKIEPCEKLILSWKHEYWKRIEEESRLLPDALPLLSNLHERFRLGLLTNAAASQNSSPRYERFPELVSAFDAIFVCDDVKIPLKPDPTGFQLILEKLDLSPAETIYVGDDWYADVCGARNAGISPVWLRHKELNRKPASLPDNDVIFIDSLLDMKQLQPGDSIEDVKRKLQGN